MHAEFNTPEQLRRSLDQAKIRAKRLLKQLHRDDPSESRRAAAQFHTLKRFANQSDEEILHRSDSIRLKDALNVIARQIGFRDWTQLKLSWEADAAAREGFDNGTGRTDINFLEHSLGGFLHNWWHTYEEAKRDLTENGGYLLCYREQFFIADRGFIRAFGLDPDDPDWEKIGFDWVHPLDPAAKQRLLHKAEQVQLQRRSREQAS
ncbi:hypothetical protein GF324_11235 [bacterium]|nr:hypothetical protein [bacterium]